MPFKRYRLKLATWMVVRAQDAPSTPRMKMCDTCATQSNMLVCSDAAHEAAIESLKQRMERV